MHYLDFSHPDPAMNLAIDEALLEAVEAGTLPPLLRLWESPSYFVVLGYSSKVKDDVHQENCRRDGIPILRRVSGGGTVLQGPGCLNYAVIEPIGSSLDILKKLLAGFAELPMDIKGTSDIVYDGKKCMGHAERRKQRTRLFHGSILYNFDLDLFERYLPIPVRQPKYRQNRSHRDFVHNLPLSRQEISKRLYRAFTCIDATISIPDAEFLAKTKYLSKEFIHRF